MTRRIREDGFAAVDRTTHTKDPGKTSSISVPLRVGGGRLAHLSIDFFSSSLSAQEAAEGYVPALQDAAAAIVARLEKQALAGEMALATRDVPAGCLLPKARPPHSIGAE